MSDQGLKLEIKLNLPLFLGLSLLVHILLITLSAVFPPSDRLELHRLGNA